MTYNVLMETLNPTRSLTQGMAQCGQKQTGEVNFYYIFANVLYG